MHNRLQKPNEPKNILKRLPEAIQYLNSLEIVQFAYLFGSLASGRHGPFSDVDVAVHLDETAVGPETKLEILGNLMDTLETDDIDLVILNRTSLPIKMNVIKSRRVILDKFPFARHLFESKTMREYFDFSFVEQNILKRRYFNGRCDANS